MSRRIPRRRSGPPAPVDAATSSAAPVWQAIGVALLVAVTVWVYLPALDGGFVWDDDKHVTRPELRSVDGLGRIWRDVANPQQYYPLVHSLFWLEHRLWGERTLGYHVVGLSLHLLSAGFLGLVLSRLRLRGAWLAASLFALHPVAVESVAWITEQKNTLSTALYLAAALAYLLFDERRQVRWYAAASALFVLALLAKTVTLTLPAALLVVLWWRRGRLEGRRDVLPLVPWMAAGVGAGLLTVLVERGLGASGEAYALTLVQRILLAGRALWFYAGKLVWPRDLAFIYPRFELDVRDPAAYVYPALAVGTLLGLWLLRGRTRAPLATALLYVGTLLPILGFFDVYYFRYAYVADHFQYLAALAPLSAAAVALTSSRLAARSRHGTLLAALLLLGTFAVRSRTQARIYRDRETLYRATLEKNPACWLASNNLGVLLLNGGQTAEAIDLLERTRALRPTSTEVLCNLARALATAGRGEEAIERYREALRLDPALTEAAQNLGYLLRSSGRAGEAIPVLEEAIRRGPPSAELENNLGAAFSDMGRWGEAIPRYEAALRLQPGSPEAEGNLGVALASTGRPVEALPHFEAALRARPDHPASESNLGYALLAVGRAADAIPHFERALRLDPRQERAASGLALARRAVGEASPSASPLTPGPPRPASGRPEPPSSLGFRPRRESQAEPKGKPPRT